MYQKTLETGHKNVPTSMCVTWGCWCRCSPMSYRCGSQHHQASQDSSLLCWWGWHLLFCTHSAGPLSTTGFCLSECGCRIHSVCFFSHRWHRKRRDYYTVMTEWPLHSTPHFLQGHNKECLNTESTCLIVVSIACGWQDFLKIRALLN